MEIIREEEERIIAQTTAWIKSVVIGCNFCPFASAALIKKSIRFVVLPDAGLENTLETLAQEMHYLDSYEETETTLIIMPNDYVEFDDYLNLIELAEDFASQRGYDGIYQIASFHPMYIFEGSTEDDSANYTNRSIYPMLHILREESITRAVETYPDTEGIPERNIEYARQKGLEYMKMLKDACL